MLSSELDALDALSWMRWMRWVSWMTRMSERKDLSFQKLTIDDVSIVVIGADRPRTFSELTDSENAVAALAIAGHSDTEIAARRGVSKKTVANQLRQIYRKLGVVSRFELAARAEQPPR